MTETNKHEVVVNQLAIRIAQLEVQKAELQADNAELIRQLEKQEEADGKMDS